MKCENPIAALPIVGVSVSMKKKKDDAFYAQGITDAGQPKLRAEYHESYYATFLIDSSEKRIKRENRVNINTQK